MMRREIVALIGTTAAWPLLGQAQQAGMPVVGSSISPHLKHAHLVSSFQQALRESTFVEGQNVRIEYCWANGDYDRLPALAVDLVNRRVAVIVAGGVLAAQAATAATATIAIVFNSGVDPVTVGIVASLSRPGGNVMNYGTGADAALHRCTISSAAVTLRMRVAGAPFWDGYREMG